jgi:formylglycine-generating enzyme required for sulfatase activity
VCAAAVIALTGCGKSTGGGTARAGDRVSHTVGGKTLNFRYVPAGKFQRDAATANVSEITRGYWMSETEVTQELYQAVMSDNPSNFTGDADTGEIRAKRPVEQVSWYEAIAFCNKMSLAAGRQPVYSVSGVSNWSRVKIPAINDANWNAATFSRSANGYRLPTEMEWMWAAMGAAAAGWQKGYAGSAENGSAVAGIGGYAWDGSNSGDRTHEVGKKTANELGLRDMSGNVWEWCWDWFGNYPVGKQTDYAGPDSGTYRVRRGGGWGSDDSGCAIAWRVINYPAVKDITLGFRILCN